MFKEQSFTMCIHGGVCVVISVNNVYGVSVFKMKTKSYVKTDNWIFLFYLRLMIYYIRVW